MHLEKRAESLRRRMKEPVPEKPPTPHRRKDCQFCFQLFPADERDRFCSKSCAAFAQHAGRLSPIEFDIWRIMHDRDYCGPSPVPLSFWPEIEAMVPYELEYRLTAASPGAPHPWLDSGGFRTR